MRSEQNLPHVGGGQAPLRVLTVTNTFPRRSWSLSSGIYVAELVSALEQQAVVSDVLVIKGRESALHYLKAPWQIRRRLSSRHYDLIHAHHGLAAATVRSASPPMVVTFHGSDLNVQWQRQLSLWTARRVAARIVVSERLREYLPGWSEVIPCGVDTTRFCATDREKARRALGLSSQRRYALFPGSPKRAVKNYPLFRSIVARLLELGHDVEGIVMDGLPPSQVPILMSAVDVLVMTSRSEGSPQTVKEALAVGLPVVSTDVGDVKWLTAGVIPGGVVTASVEAFLTMVMPILTTQARSDGAKRIQELQLDWRGIARRVRGVYDRVLRENSNAG